MKLNSEQIENLKRDYKRGLSLVELKTLYDISVPTIKKHLGDTKQIKRQSRVKFRDKALIDDFCNGLVNITAIANKYNITEQVVKNILYKYNLIRRPIKGYGDMYTKRIVELHDNKVEGKEIAKQLNISYSYVRAIITKHRKEIGLYTGKCGHPITSTKPRKISIGRAYGELRKAVIEELAKGNKIKCTQFAKAHGVTKQRVSKLIKALSINK